MDPVIWLLKIMFMVVVTSASRPQKMKIVIMVAVSVFIRQPLFLGQLL